MHVMFRLPLIVMLIWVSLAQWAIAETIWDYAPAKHQQILDHGDFAEFVYEGDRKFTPQTKLYQQGWRELNRANKPDGHRGDALQFQVYQKAHSDGTIERVIAFAGTDKLIDHYTNAVQGVVPWGYVFSQYAQAREIVEAHQQEARRNPNIKLSVTGHSMGGGMAQYASFMNNVPAYVFQSAAVNRQALVGGSPLGHVKGAQAAQAWAKGNIVNIQSIGDFIHATPGVQLGDIALVSMAPIVGKDGQRLISHGRATRKFKEFHNIGNMNDLLKYQVAVGPDVAPEPVYFDRKTYTGLRNSLFSSYQGLTSVIDTTDIVLNYELFDKTSRKIETFSSAQPKLITTPMRIMSHISKVVGAMDKDIEQASSGGQVRVSSETLHAVGQVAFSEFIGLKWTGNKFNGARFNTAVIFAEGGFDLARGVEISLNGGSERKIEGVTLAFDGFNRLAAAGLGLAVSGGNKDVAAAFAGTAQLAAETGRWATFNPMLRWQARRSGADKRILDNYHNAMRVRIAKGLKAIHFEEFVRNEPFQLAIVNSDIRKRAHAEYNLGPYKKRSRMMIRRTRNTWREVCIRGWCSRTPIDVSELQKATQAKGSDKLSHQSAKPEVIEIRPVRLDSCDRKKCTVEFPDQKYSALFFDDRGPGGASIDGGDPPGGAGGGTGGGPPKGGGGGGAAGIGGITVNVTVEQSSVDEGSNSLDLLKGCDISKSASCDLSGN